MTLTPPTDELVDRLRRWYMAPQEESAQDLMDEASDVIEALAKEQSRGQEALEVCGLERDLARNLLRDANTLLAALGARREDG